VPPSRAHHPAHRSGPTLAARGTTAGGFDLDDEPAPPANSNRFWTEQLNEFGAGAVYERQLSCEDGQVLDCDDVYPELTIGVVF
jgi:hypothetical protein